MPKNVIDICILPEEYDIIVQLLSSDSSLPGTYDEWLKQRLEENVKRRSRGETLQEIVVHPQELTEYAAAVGQPLSNVILGAVAVKKSRRNS